MRLDLDISASVHRLFELAAVAVQHQGSPAVGFEREGRVGRHDRERSGRPEREVHRLAHPLPLLVGHVGATASTPAPAKPSAPSPSPSEAPTPAAEAAAATSSSEPRRAAPIAPGAVALLHHGARVVALPGVVRPMTREIGSLSGRGHPAHATNQGRTGEHYDGCRIHIAPSLDRWASRSTERRAPYEGTTDERAGWRSEERRVGKECRARWWPCNQTKKAHKRGSQ